MNKCILLAALGALLGSAIGCGVPCDMLEDKICEELGEADCKIWKDSGAPEQLRSGRRASRACLNALSGPAFDAHLQGARGMVDVLKASGS